MTTGPIKQQPSLDDTQQFAREPQVDVAAPEDTKKESRFKITEVALSSSDDTKSGEKVPFEMDDLHLEDTKRNR